MKLHGYFRSSASYRVRIALNLKGLSAEHLSHHLRKGEQRAPDYLAINPQGFVPTLQGDGGIVFESPGKTRRSGWAVADRKAQPVATARWSAKRIGSLAPEKSAPSVSVSRMSTSARFA